jgi:hypothetical protein
MRKFIWDSRKTTRWALCVGCSAVFLYLAVRGTHAAQVWESLQKTHLSQTIVPVLLLFVSFWIRAWRWRYLLLPLKAIPLMPLFRSTVIGFMGNYLFPLRAGELIRAVAIGQSQQISNAGVLGSIVLERILDGMTLSILPFLVLAVLDLPSWVMQVNLALLAIYMVALSIVMVSTIHRRTAIWIKRFSGLLPGSIAGRLASIAEHFFHGMKGLNRAGALLPVLSLSLLCWLVHGMYYFLLFSALDLNLSIWAALVLQAVIGIGVMLPAGPGYVGNFEYSTVLGLALFGVAKEEAFAYSLLAHSLQFFPVVLVGSVFAIRGGFGTQIEAERARVVTSSS